MRNPLRPVTGTTIRQNEDVFEYVFDTPPTYTTFLTILHLLPRGHELTFFDQYFPSASDPGAFVSVQRKADKFMYHIGNHGWSTEWQLQSANLIAAWMALNANAKNNCSESMSTVCITKASQSPLYPQVDKVYR
ncbi:hypothetical protein MCAMS1_02767 [biofilm metagenome]